MFTKTHDKGHLIWTLNFPYLLRLIYRNRLMLLDPDTLPKAVLFGRGVTLFDIELGLLGFRYNIKWRGRKWAKTVSLLDIMLGKKEQQVYPAKNPKTVPITKSNGNRYQLVWGRQYTKRARLPFGRTTKRGWLVIPIKAPHDPVLNTMVFEDSVHFHEYLKTTADFKQHLEQLAEEGRHDHG